MEGELDRRHPEREQLREMRTADDYRAMWDTIERLWAETRPRRAATRTCSPLRVDDEWSFVETLRHLVLATDKWVGHTILDKPTPYHPLGLRNPGSRGGRRSARHRLDARPPLAEVMEVRRNRMALVRGIVDGLTDAGLERISPRLPAPGYPEETRSVGLACASS